LYYKNIKKKVKIVINMLYYLLCKKFVEKNQKNQQFILLILIFLFIIF